MKNFLSLCSATVFALLALATGLKAQEAPRYTFDFYVLGWDASATHLQYESLGKLAPVVVTPNLITGPYRYSGNAPMQFVSKSTAADGTTQFKPEAQLQLNGNPSAPLLLVFTKPAEAGPLPYRVLGMSNVIALSSTNEVTLINFSSDAVGGKLNDATFVAQPGAVQQVRVVPGKNLNVSLRLARQTQDGWEHAFSTIWGENPRTQSLVFVIPDPHRPDQLVVKRVQLNRHLTIEQNTLADQRFADPFSAADLQEVKR